MRKNLADLKQMMMIQKSKNISCICLIFCIIQYVTSYSGDGRSVGTRDSPVVLGLLRRLFLPPIPAMFVQPGSLSSSLSVIWIL